MRDKSILGIVHSFHHVLKKKSEGKQKGKDKHAMTTPGQERNILVQTSEKNVKIHIKGILKK